MMPDPLDIMFVLGNENALPLLKPELEKYPYAYKLEEMRYLVDQYDDSFWEQSLYNTWLSAIRSLNPPVDMSKHPFFMQTSAWQIQKLNTQLASWAELRHDNILYAKQSYTGGTSCSFPHAYIEPYPELYDLLAQFANRAHDFFQNELSGIQIEMKPELLDYYNTFAGHMLKFKTLAEKELKNQVFTPDEITYLKTFINEYMASGPSISGWYLDLFFDGGLPDMDFSHPALKEDHIVVDVHTQPTDEGGNDVGKILHVGTGNINLGIFCTGSPSADYEPMAFIGPLMSFHDSITEKWKRFNDEEWAEFFWNQEDSPSRPSWAYQYLVNIEGKTLFDKEEPNIPGVLFAGSDIDPDPFRGNIDYLIAFPNPATDNVKLRYILKKTAEIKLDVIDILGRTVYSEYHPLVTAGEHETIVNMSQNESGLYYIKLLSGTETKVVKLLMR
jgi:hypothetical protein